MTPSVAKIVGPSYAPSNTTDADFAVLPPQQQRRVQLWLAVQRGLSCHEFMRMLDQLQEVT